MTMHSTSKGMVTEGPEQVAESDTCSVREVTKILLYHLYLHNWHHNNITYNMRSHTVGQWAPFVWLKSTINGARGKVRSEMKSRANSMSYNIYLLPLNTTIFIKYPGYRMSLYFICHILHTYYICNIMTSCNQDV